MRAPGLITSRDQRSRLAASEYPPFCIAGGSSSLIS